MAITVTNLGASSGTTPTTPDTHNINDDVSYSTPSFAWPTSGIIVGFFMTGHSQGIDAITIGGDSGLRWQPVADLVWNGGTRRMECAIADASTAQTGVVEMATYVTPTSPKQARQLSLYGYMYFFQLTGIDMSGGITGVVEQVAMAAPAAATSGSLTFGAPTKQGNLRVVCFDHNANEAPTIDATWTTIDSWTGAGPALGGATSYSTTALTQSNSWTTSAASGFLGIEFAADPTLGGAYSPLPAYAQAPKEQSYVTDFVTEEPNLDAPLSTGGVKVMDAQTNGAKVLHIGTNVRNLTNDGPINGGIVRIFIGTSISDCHLFDEIAVGTGVTGGSEYGAGDVAWRFKEYENFYLGANDALFASFQTDGVTFGPLAQVQVHFLAF